MNRQYAEKLIAEAKELNGGAWIDHSYNVARLAEKLASKANMDGGFAYIMNASKSGLIQL